MTYSKNMPQQTLSAIVATTSATIGGTAKATLSYFDSIDLTSAISVAFYAGLSAIVGLLVKSGYSKITRTLKKRRGNR